MSERFPLRSLSAEEGSNEGVLATELKPGYYSPDQQRRIESVTRTEDGRIQVVFERNGEEIQQNKEGLIKYLKPDQRINVDRGTFHSFIRDTTLDSDTLP